MSTTSRAAAALIAVLLLAAACSGGSDGDTAGGRDDEETEVGDTDLAAQAYVAGYPLVVSVRTMQRLGGLLHRHPRPAVGADGADPARGHRPTATTRTSSSTPGRSRSPTSAPGPPTAGPARG